MTAVVDQSARGWWIIIVSFFVAMIFAVITLPNLSPLEFGFLRPDWVLLVLIYWVIALPQRVGILTGWVLGLMMDILLGTLLGQHAVVFMVIAYVAANLYQRLRMFAVWQQSLVVLVLVGIAQLLSFWIESLVGPNDWSLWMLMPAVMSALVWPWMFLLLRFLRRFFGVT
ncbi:MAG: rod shape-determining protein MreD [Patiriisocius sp.]|jgi:rod shape-determining protein MreD